MKRYVRLSPVNALVTAILALSLVLPTAVMPVIVASGRRIVSVLAPCKCVPARQYPDRIIDKKYLRLSGTSAAAPKVAGTAALILKAHLDWTLDQVKSALMNTARPLASAGSGRGEGDAVAAVAVNTPGYANQGIALSAGVAGLAKITVYDSATWNSATWNSATWNGATWNSVTWNSILPD